MSKRKIHHRVEYRGARMSCGREITLIIEPPDLLGFREKGRRKILYLTIGGAAMYAAQLEAERIRGEKRKRRRGGVSRGLLAVERKM